MYLCARNPPRFGENERTINRQAQRYAANISAPQILSLTLITSVAERKIEKLLERAKRTPSMTATVQSDRKETLTMSVRIRGRVAVTLGGLVLAVVLSGCGGGEKEAPSTSTSTPTTSSPPVTPTEKGLDPTGANKFTPSVHAPPAPTAIPGSH